MKQKLISILHTLLECSSCHRGYRVIDMEMDQQTEQWYCADCYLKLSKRKGK